MKITIELNSLDELNEVTMRLLPLMHTTADDPPTFIEGSDREPPVIDRDKTDLYDGVEPETAMEYLERNAAHEQESTAPLPELTRAQKAGITRAKNKKIKEQEIAAEEAFKREQEPVEGELLPAVDSNDTGNVIPLAGVEGDADAEELAQTAAAQEEHVDMDALRDRFHALVNDDWDAAAKILDDLGVDNFTEAMGAGFASAVAQKLGEVAVA